MIVKEGVVLRGLNWRMRRVLQVAERIWDAYGNELVVTSGLEGEHSEWSWHKYGMAVDLRTRYFSTGETQSVANDLAFALGRPYQVVVESTHIHVECDMEAG